MRQLLLEAINEFETLVNATDGVTVDAYPQLKRMVGLDADIEEGWRGLDFNQAWHDVEEAIEELEEKETEGGQVNAQASCKRLCDKAGVLYVDKMQLTWDEQNRTDTVCFLSMRLMGVHVLNGALQVIGERQFELLGK